MSSGPCNGLSDIVLICHRSGWVGWSDGGSVCSVITESRDWNSVISSRLPWFTHWQSVNHVPWHRAAGWHTPGAQQRATLRPYWTQWLWSVACRLLQCFTGKCFTKLISHYQGSQWPGELKNFVKRHREFLPARSYASVVLAVIMCPSV